MESKQCRLHNLDLQELRWDRALGEHCHACSLSGTTASFWSSQLHLDSDAGAWWENVEPSWFLLISQLGEMWGQ